MHYFHCRGNICSPSAIIIITIIIIIIIIIIVIIIIITTIIMMFLTIKKKIIIIITIICSTSQTCCGAWLIHQAIQCLTSVSNAVVSEMLLKHPQASPPQALPSPVPPSIEIVDSIFIKAIKSFPSGTAPGPSGLRASHLKEALCCTSAKSSSMFLKSLCKFVNLLCLGKL